MQQAVQQHQGEEQVELAAAHTRDAAGKKAQEARLPALHQLGQPVAVQQLLRQLLTPVPAASMRVSVGGCTCKCWLFAYLPPASEPKAR